eukprot:jgi/Psemu1/47328/gm1.47328_g
MPQHCIADRRLPLQSNSTLNSTHRPHHPYASMTHFTILPMVTITTITTLIDIVGIPATIVIFYISFTVVSVINFITVNSASFKNTYATSALPPPMTESTQIDHGKYQSRQHSHTQRFLKNLILVRSFSPTLQPSQKHLLPTPQYTSYIFVHDGSVVSHQTPNFSKEICHFFLALVHSHNLSNNSPTVSNTSIHDIGNLLNPPCPPLILILAPHLGRPKHGTKSREPPVAMPAIAHISISFLPHPSYPGIKHLMNPAYGLYILFTGILLGDSSNLHDSANITSYAKEQLLDNIHLNTFNMIDRMKTLLLADCFMLPAPSDNSKTNKLLHTAPHLECGVHFVCKNKRYSSKVVIALYIYVNWTSIFIDMNAIPIDTHNFDVFSTIPFLKPANALTTAIPPVTTAGNTTINTQQFIQLFNNQTGILQY